ncbi:MAG: response regulator [Alphaproteobacteria bacterium]|nr:response regulator [Alphaproteobacteria bacterium]
MAELETKTLKRQRQMAKLARIGVLLVDNDSKILDLLTNVLTRLGFEEIFTAHDGFEGLQILEEKDIDLVITDWELKPVTELSADDVEPNEVITTDWQQDPPKDGASFVRYLRCAPSSPNRYIPIIMLTGSTLVDNIEYARDSGVSEILKKPITAKVLCDRVISCIESPRSHITAPSYKGPDRRRKVVPVDEERRKIDIKVIKHTGA